MRITTIKNGEMLTLVAKAVAKAYIIIEVEYKATVKAREEQLLTLISRDEHNSQTTIMLVYV